MSGISTRGTCSSKKFLISFILIKSDNLLNLLLNPLFFHVRAEGVRKSSCACYGHLALGECVIQCSQFFRQAHFCNKTGEKWAFFLAIIRALDRRKDGQNSSLARHLLRSATPLYNVNNILLRYNFVPVSQSVNQGTVNPTSYNVVKDISGLLPLHI